MHIAVSDNRGQFGIPLQNSGGYYYRHLMRIEKTHSHLNGEEWLMVHRPAILKTIKRVVGWDQCREVPDGAQREK